MSTRNYRSTVQEQLAKIEARRTQDLQLLLREQGEAGDDRYDANTVYNMTRDELRAAAEEYVDATIVAEIEEAIANGFPLDERLRHLIGDAVAEATAEGDDAPPESPLTSAEIVERLRDRHGMTSVEIRDLVNDTVIKEGIAAEADEEPGTAPLADYMIWTEARRVREAREQAVDIPGFGLDEASDDAVRKVLDEAAAADEDGEGLSDEELRDRLAEVTRALDTPLQQAIEDAGLVDLAERFREAAEDAQAATETVKDAIAAAAVAAERDSSRLVDEAVEAARTTIEEATAAAEDAVDRVRETTREAAEEFAREADRAGGSVDDAIAQAIDDVEAANNAIGDLLARTGDAMNTIGGVSVTFDLGAVLDGIGADDGADGMNPTAPGEEPPPQQTVGQRLAGGLEDRLAAESSGSTSDGGSDSSGTPGGDGGSSGSTGGLLGGTDPSMFDKGVIPSGQTSSDTSGGTSGGTGGTSPAGTDTAGGPPDDDEDEWTPGWENVGDGETSYTKGEDGTWEEDEPLDPETRARIDADAEAEAEAEADEADDGSGVEYTPSGESGGRMRADPIRDQYQEIIREAEANSNINPTREGTEVPTGSATGALDSDSLKQPAPDGDMAQPDIVVRGPGFGSSQGDGAIMPTPDANVAYEQGLGGDVPTDVGRDPGLGHLAETVGQDAEDDAPESVLPAGVSPADLRIGDDLLKDASDLRHATLPPTLAPGGLSAIAPTYEDANPAPVDDPGTEDVDEPAEQAAFVEPLDPYSAARGGEEDEPLFSLPNDDDTPSRWIPEVEDAEESR